MELADLLDTLRATVKAPDSNELHMDAIFQYIAKPVRFSDDSDSPHAHAKINTYMHAATHVQTTAEHISSELWLVHVLDGIYVSASGPRDVSMYVELVRRLGLVWVYELVFSDKASDAMPCPAVFRISAACEFPMHRWARMSASSEMATIYNRHSQTIRHTTSTYTDNYEVDRMVVVPRCDLSEFVLK